MHIFFLIFISFKSFSAASHTAGASISSTTIVTSHIGEDAGIPALILPLQPLHIAALVDVKQNSTAKKKPLPETFATKSTR